MLCLHCYILNFSKNVFLLKMSLRWLANRGPTQDFWLLFLFFWNNACKAVILTLCCFNGFDPLWQWWLSLPSSPQSLLLPSQSAVTSRWHPAPALSSRATSSAPLTSTSPGWGPATTPVWTPGCTCWPTFRSRCPPWAPISPAGTSASPSTREGWRQNESSSPWKVKRLWLCKNNSSFSQFIGLHVSRPDYFAYNSCMCVSISLWVTGPGMWQWSSSMIYTVGEPFNKVPPKYMGLLPSPAPHNSPQY